MAAVISCISCPSETVKTLTAACCASIYNSFKRLNKMCSRSYIWKCCDVLQIDWWIPPNCSFVFYSCIHQQAHTTVLSSLMEKLYGTICYGNTVCNKLFVFARSDFLPLTTKAEKWNQLWWINHDFIHIKEIFLPTTKLPVRLLKKKVIPQMLQRWHCSSSPSLCSQWMTCWNFFHTTWFVFVQRTHMQPGANCYMHMRVT